MSDLVADWADEIRTMAAELGDPLPRRILETVAETCATAVRVSPRPRPRRPL
ncbi:hypothetical protein ACWGMO_25605 [Nocardia salmonicida]